MRPFKRLSCFYFLIKPLLMGCLISFQLAAQGICTGNAIDNSSFSTFKFASSQNLVKQTFKSTFDGKISRVGVIMDFNSGFTATNVLELSIKDSLNTTLATISKSVTITGTNSFVSFDFEFNNAPILQNGHNYSLNIRKLSGGSSIRMQVNNFLYENGEASGLTSVLSTQDLAFVIAKFKENLLTVNPSNDCSKMPEILFTDNANDVATYNLYYNGVLLTKAINGPVAVKQPGYYFVQKVFSDNCFYNSNTVTLDASAIPILIDSVHLTADSILLNGQFYKPFDKFNVDSIDSQGCLVKRITVRILPTNPECSAVLHLLENSQLINNSVNFTNSKYTIALWAKRERLNKDEVVFRIGPATNTFDGIHFGWRASNKVYISHNGPNNNLEVDGPVDTNWHHYVMTFLSLTNLNSSLQEIYCDGQLLGSLANGFNFSSGNTEMMLGSFKENIAGFQGYIDDLQMWKGQILDSAAVAQLYAGNNAIHTSQKVLFFDFNETRGRGQLVNRVNNQVTTLNKIDDFESITDSLGAAAGPAEIKRTVLLPLGDTLNVFGSIVNQDTLLNHHFYTDKGCDSLIITNVLLDNQKDPVNDSCNTVLKLNGSQNENFLNSGPNISSKSFTVSVWIKRDRVKTEEIFYTLGSQESTNKSLHLGFRANDGILMGFYANDLVVIREQNTQWHHYAFTYDVATGKRSIYMDGMLLKSETGVAPFSGNQTEIFGAFINNSVRFKGMMEDFEVWETALSPSEIQQLHDSNHHIKLENKLAYYDFNEIRGTNQLTNLVDGSKRGFTALVGNNVLTNFSGQPTGTTQAITNLTGLIGNPLVFNNVSYTTDTILVDTLVNQFGCDSIATVIIKFNTLEENCNTVLHMTDKKDDLPGGPNLANSSYSISMWAKRKKVVNGVGPLEITFRIGTEDVSRKALHLGWRENGNILFGTGSNDLEVFKTPDNNWHHYTFVYDRDPSTSTGTMKIYYDGVLISSAANKNDFIGNSTMRFGAFGINDTAFNGFLEDLQIWKDVALSDAEVLAVYNSDFTVNAPNKTHHFEFNDVRGRDRFKNTVNNTFYNLTNIKTATSLTDSLGVILGAISGPDQNISIKAGQTVEIEGIQVSTDTTFDVTYTNTLGCDSLVKYIVSLDYRLDPDTADCNLVLKTDGIKTEAFNNAGPDFANKSFSASFWVKRDRINTLEVYFSLGSELAPNKVLHLGFRADNKVIFGFTNPDLDIDAPADTEWHHYMFVYDLAEPTNKMKIYKDGFLIGQGAGSAFTGNTSIILGAYPDGGAKFKGQLEDITLWDRVLTSEEVLAYHLGDKSIAEANKKLVWDFQEILGQNVITNRVDNSTVTPNVFNRNTDIVNLNGVVKGNSVSNLSFTACQAFDFNGQILTVSGIYHDTITNTIGCDSLITLNLTMNASFSEIDATVCGSYMFNGQNLTQSGVYLDTLTNAVGCDSVITLNLTILPAIHSTDVQTTCGSFTWIDGITYTSSTNLPMDTLVSITGCDSIVHLNLTILQPTVSELTISQCISYDFNGKLLTSSGDYLDTLTNAVGCDSLITLHLSIFEPSSSELVLSECESYDFNGTLLTATGIYKDTLVSAAGCDSVVTLNLTILRPDTVNISVSTCDSYFFDGQFRNTTDLYTATFTNSAGCDSVVNLDLVILGQTFSEQNILACGSYFYEDSLYTKTTSVSFTVPNSAGCDSIVVLGFIILPTSDSSLTVSACGSYKFNGSTLTSSGIYTDTLENAAGCDSIVTLNLTILQPSSNQISQTACQQFDFNGTILTASGIYTDTLTNAVGCDSVITLNLTILPPSTASINISACNSFDFNGTILTASGIYKDTLVNAAGCDSIITLNLTIATPVTATLSGNAVIAPGSTASLSVAFTGTAPYTVVINGVTHSGISANLFLVPVSPTVTTTYAISTVSNAICGAGTASGSATVTVENSPCPPNLTVPISVNKIYRAQNQLKSNVNASHQTTYTAGKAIVLEPGFQVGANETFEARIQGCNN